MTLTVTNYERIWIEGLNRGDVSVADEAFAPNCIIHIAGLLTAFPDLQLRVEDQIISGDKVATRWSAEGTHTGPLGDSQPTGKRAQIEGLILDRVVGEQVVERWEQWDQMEMLQQLGIL